MLRFSVIVPVYNIEKYLPSCIDSVLSQSFYDYELILIDDGSTDSSGLICDSYAHKDKRIKVIHKTNGGLSDARNKGLENVSGEYIIFLDGDDQLSDGALEAINDNIEDNIDIYFFNHNLLSENNIRPSKINYKTEITKINNVSEKLDLIFLGNNINNWCIWNKVYLTKFVKDNNFVNDVNAYGCEDFDWILKLIFKSNYVKAVNEPIINYRVDNYNSITHTKNFKRLNNFLDYIIKWNADLNSLALDEKDIQKIKDVLSRQYISIIGYYCFFNKNEKKMIKNKIKQSKYFFNQTSSKEVKIIKLLYNVLGLTITSKLIAFYKKWKNANIK